METENPLKRTVIKWSIIFLGIILIFTILSKTIYTFLLPKVTTERVSSGKIETKILAEGKIGYDKLMIGSKKIAVQAPNEGAIIECYVEENQIVKKGDPLIKLQKTLDVDKVKQEEQQNAEVALNESSYEREIQEHEEKQKEISEKLAKKQEELASGKKSYEVISIESQITEKEQVVADNEALYEAGALSSNECSKAKEALELLRKQKESVMQSERDKIQADIEELEDKEKDNESEIAALKEKLKLEENKRLTNSSSGDQMTITSPIDGTVYEVNVAAGASALVHDTLMVIVPSSIPITLSFNVNDKNADKIKVGEEITWTNDQEPAKATVMKKNYDEKTSETIITCKVDEASIRSLISDLKTYKSVDVEAIETSDTYNMLVSSSALVSEGTSTYIYTVEEVQTAFETNYIVHKNLVTVLKKGDYTSAVSGALEENGEIVKTTTKTLSEGAQVQKD